MTDTNFFANDTDMTVFEAGETIFKKGDAGTVMYGVQEGIVELYYRDQFIRTVKPGEVFGEMAVVDFEPRSATAIAKTMCKLVVIDTGEFLFRVQHEPRFALFVLQTTVTRLREETHRR